MKKRVIIIASCIAAVLAVVLTVVILLAGNKPDLTAPIEPETAYKGTLTDIRGILSDPENTELVGDGMYGVHEAILALGDEADRTVGYAYSDLDKDGQSELLIGNFEGTGSSDVKNEIYAAYTFDGDLAVPLLEKQKRNTFALTDTGTLYFHGSDGEAFHIVAEYEITVDGIVCKNFYFSYPKFGDINDLEIFHNTTGQWDPKASEKVDMTLEQLEELRKEIAARTVPIDAQLLAQIEAK